MIQLIGSALIWISLGVGTLACVTAYRPLLESVANSERPLTLGTPAGKTTGDGDDVVPLFSPPMTITQSMISDLRAQNVERIGVKEFSLDRWNEKYWFLASAIGLVVGAALMRQTASAHDQLGGKEGSDDPIDALAQAAIEINRLVDEIRSEDLDARTRTHKIAESLEQVRRSQFETFTGSGPVLRRQLGLSGFARLMDAFASAERKLNRAWSAAVDQCEDESIDCLQDGQQLLHEAMKRLDSLKEL